MKKYCCDRFKLSAELPRESGLNIRIIKFDKTELMDSSKQFRFFVTPGYTSESKGIPTLNIAFCPWCGKNLFNYYKADEYANETYKDFLYP